jgi:hypothetical protein
MKFKPKDFDMARRINQAEAKLQVVSLDIPQLDAAAQSTKDNNLDVLAKVCSPVDCIMKQPMILLLMAAANFP